MPTWDASISSGGAGTFTLRLTTTENAFPASNTSTINYTLQIICGSGFAFNNNLSTTWTVNLQDLTYSGNFAYNLSAGQTLTLVNTTSDAILHNPDGSAIISVRGRISGPGPLTAGDTGSQTWALTDFVRVPDAPASCTVAVTGRNALVTSGVASATGKPAVTSYQVERTTNDGVTWSGTVNTMDGSRQFTYSNLDGGKTYKFRTRGVNSDGAGAWTESASTFIPAGGRRWNGTSWVATEIARRWNGSAWVDLTIARRWNGSAWVDLS